MTQFVAVRFNPWDRRSYTYHNDGPLVAIGDRIRVPSPEGEKVVEVTALPTEKPPFETKPIIGRVPHPEGVKED